MVVSYNKLWKLLIDRKMNKVDLRRAAGSVPNTMTKLNRNDYIWNNHDNYTAEENMNEYEFKVV